MKRTARTTTRITIRTTAQRIVQITVLTTGQTAQTAGMLQAARTAQITTRTTARRTQVTTPATAQVRIQQHKVVCHSDQAVTIWGRLDLREGTSQAGMPAFQLGDARERGKLENVFLIVYAKAVTFYIIMSYNVIKKNVISMSFSIIPIQDLENYLKRPGTILIDLREEEDFEQGHIKGARNIPYERWQVEKETWTHRYDTVVFYCERGNQSMYAAREMNRKGYYAISIAGGYQGYKVWKRKETKAE